ncbi:L,D-transpeptidase [Microvirga thermotolerans]|uniref:L,D-transpeptidase family protein n=1 Tax=Microvirga thermotolerans TaxID=2651334 RepID=A0A5P9JW79_9HYPH|nr:L,D-transpeptidase [Microvirga thermotolerans]QFU15690.1 L,D-transpeptidase family protein [Microvirga thermotolerans]
MRLLLPCTAALVSLLASSAAFAQPVGYYAAPRDVYGNVLVVPNYGYPPGYPQDGYRETYPSVTRPAPRARAYRNDPMVEYAYGAAAALPGDLEHGYDDSLDYAIKPQYERQIVAYNGREKPGTIIIDTPNRFLYLVQPGGRAIRYGIGVGRPGFEWAGRKTVSMKREWPDWRPPAEMLRRRPDLPKYMPGGPDNPLGARALYLGSSLYRIHGTNEPHTIGQAVSSGCIRMLNRDVIDLYNRVPVGAPVIVI